MQIVQGKLISIAQELGTRLLQLDFYVSASVKNYFIFSFFTGGRVIRCILEVPPKKLQAF